MQLWHIYPASLHLAILRKKTTELIINMNIPIM